MSAQDVSQANQKKGSRANRDASDKSGEQSMFGETAADGVQEGEDLIIRSHGG